MNTPSFDVEPAPPVLPAFRNPAGWVVLALLLGFMLVTELASYFNRDSEDSSHRFDIVETELGAAVKTRAVAHIFGGMAPAGKSESNVKKADSEFESTLNEQVVKLRGLKAKDASAARLYAVIMTELGRAVKPEDIAVLKSKKDAVNQAYNAIYGGPLSPDEARSWVAKLPKKLISDRLAAVQALEKAGLPSGRSELVPQNTAQLMIGAIIVVVLAIGAGGLLLLIYLVGYAQGAIRPKGFPAGELTLPQADIFAMRAAQLLGLFLLVPVLIAGAAHEVRVFTGQRLDRDAAEILIYISIIAAYYWIGTRRVGGSLITWASLGLRRDDLGKNILWGLGGALANLPVVLCLGYIGQKIFSGLPPAEHPITIELSGASFATLLRVILTGAVFAPLIEETMFRGHLLPALNALTRSPWSAIAIQGILFACIHPTGIPAWLPLAAIGAMSGLLTYQTRSLVPSLVMHGVHNFATLIFAILLT